LNKLAKQNRKSHESDQATASLILAGSTLSIIGSVHFDNASLTYRDGKKILETLNTPLITIDLAQLTQSHTVLLAVIVQWVRGLGTQQRIHLENVPAKMKSIIQASRLEEVL
jgi:ABC-type transporter Mla MlaB component